MALTKETILKNLKIIADAIKERKTMQLTEGEALNTLRAVYRITKDTPDAQIRNARS